MHLERHKTKNKLLKTDKHNVNNRSNKINIIHGDYRPKCDNDTCTIKRIYS